jgi:hypothetical protein
MRHDSSSDATAPVSQDIDAALQGWEFSPGVVQARLVQTSTGREVIQLRIDLGLLQMETTGRPDGTRPNGFPSYYHYLQSLAQPVEGDGPSFTLSEEHCLEADREFVQFYHRRLCWLALRQFDRAVADADHTLAFMDFVRDHSPGEEYTQAHEQYRGFVVFQRTQAAAAQAVENQDAEAAIDAIDTGLKALREFFIRYDAEAQMEDDSMVQRLRQLEKSLRQTHGIEATLREQLDQAVAREDYETAARIRDVLRKRN